MSAPNPSDGGASGASGGDLGDEKPRLTEAEKKQNHIASEQKRRMAIREGFDRLTELVPGLEGQGRSEGLVLQRTVAFMREQLEERKALIAQIEAEGGTVDPAIKQNVIECEKHQAAVLKKRGDAGGSGAADAHNE